MNTFATSEGLVGASWPGEEIITLATDGYIVEARAGLADPDVTVEAVNCLPRHPETGKLRRVISA